MKKNLQELELEDFDKYAVWYPADDEKVYGELDLDFVKPLRKEAIIKSNESLMIVRFRGKMADGTEIAGITSVSSPPPEIEPSPSYYYKGEWHCFFRPPAPPHVIAKEGPHCFAEKIKKTMNDIFPITIQTDAIFEDTGKQLEVIITENENITAET